MELREILTVKTMQGGKLIIHKPLPLFSDKGSSFAKFALGADNPWHADERRSRAILHNLEVTPSSARVLLTYANHSSISEFLWRVNHGQVNTDCHIDLDARFSLYSDAARGSRRPLRSSEAQLLLRSKTVLLGG